MGSSDYAGKSAYRGTVASRYDADREVEAVWQQEQEFVRTWAETLPPGGTLLDLPTGTGRFLDYFAARQLEVHALDISEDMLAEVRRKHGGVGGERLHVRVGDAEQLDLPAGSVDHILCWRFLHLVPMPVVKRVLREFSRVSRGVVVMHVFAVDACPSPRLVAWVKACLRPLWRRLRRAPETAGDTPWSHITSYSHREPELLRAFKAAGFAVEKIHTFDPAAPFPTRVYFLRSAAARARVAPR